MKLGLHTVDSDPFRSVATPVGEELVLDNDLQEPTRVYAEGQLARLLPEASPHRHVTARMLYL